MIFNDKQSSFHKIDWNEKLKQLGNGYLVNNSIVSPDLSIGLATGCVPSETDIETLLIDARLAATAATSSSRVREFETSMRTKAEDENHLIDKIRKALDNKEFIPYYQIKFSAQTRRPCAMEALCRWQQPNGKAESHLCADRRI